MASASRPHSPARFRLLLLAAALGLLSIAGCTSNRKPAPLAPRYTALPDKQVPDFLKGTIFQRVDVENPQPDFVNNYGLVVNLSGPTGDAQNAPLAIRDYIIRQMSKHGIGSPRGVAQAERIQPEEMLRDPRNAIVRVDGGIPPGARKGQRFDVIVSALDVGQNNTSSLAGGTLWQTDLQRGGIVAPGKLIENFGVCDGPIFVNPEYALRDPKNPAVKQSLRFGTIPGGGKVLRDHAIGLRVRSPGWRGTREIENRIDAHFQDGSVAAAQDEGRIETLMPFSFKGDWEHFVGVITHLYFNQSAEFGANKSRELAELAVKPDAPLMDISYCWEGLGTNGLPYVISLMTHPSPDVAFAAARAAAYVGDSSALTILADMAHNSGHPFQVSAVQVLGSLPSSPVINQMLRGLLDAPEATVRIEAYRVLAESRDASIYSKEIGQKFILDIVPSKGPPLVYATRRGAARLAIFGNRPTLDLPAAFSALDNRLTITSSAGERAVKIFYRDPTVSRPVPILSNPDIAEIVARLGGEGPDDAPQRLNFSYGEIVAVVQAMTRGNQVVAKGQGTAFVLQDMPRTKDEVDTAPVIPDLQSRPQGDTSATQPIGQIPEMRTDARK